MQSTSQPKALPDDELLRRLAALLASSRRSEADLLAHMGEVDARRLHAREATPSMFAYCLERLRLSEPEAYLRIAAARAAREHPVILEMLADGRLHLTGIALLAPHLTRDNRDALLGRAAHKTKREIEELVAGLAPRPDVRPSIRKLPLGRVVSSPAARERVPAALELRPEQVDSHRLGEVAARPGSHPAADGAPGGDQGVEQAPARPAGSDCGLRWAAHREPGLARIEPLSPTRYKVQFTATAELRDKLERLTALMRSSIPDGDLAAIIDAAVTEKLERLEARRFGRTKAPRQRSPRKDPGQAENGRTSTSGSALQTRPTSRYVPAEVRRAVHERDEARCRYVDDQGRRCTARVRLEFHHRRPFGVGGDHAPANVSLLCEAHNRLLARIDFGAEAVDGHRRTTGTASSTPGKT